MTEDNRIPEIRAEVSNPFWADFDNPHVQQLLDSIRAILDSAPPAPRVWFPGDILPRGAAAMNEDGDLVAGAYRVMAIDGPQVELATLSLEEWQAAVDRASEARAIPEPTEGQNPHG